MSYEQTEAHWYFVGRMRSIFNRYLCDKFGPKEAVQLNIKITEIFNK